MPEGAKGIGVIAQDVKDIIPYTIATFKAKLNPEDTTDTELYSFNSSALTFVTTNAIKELHSRLAILETGLLNTNPQALPQPSLISLLKGVGLTIIEGVNNARTLIVEALQTYNFKIGSADKPTGFTIYDKITKDPYCITLENGEFIKNKGECEIITAGELPNNTSATTNPAPVAGTQNAVTGQVLGTSTTATAGQVTTTPAPTPTPTSQPQAGRVPKADTAPLAEVPVETPAPTTSSTPIPAPTTATPTTVPIPDATPTPTPQPVTAPPLAETPATDSPIGASSTSNTAAPTGSSTSATSTPTTTTSTLTPASTPAATPVPTSAPALEPTPASEPAPDTGTATP
ncbi:MAG: hypothetical protein HY973_04180 [Candidatus Kerfeldbacteria bacterium]|nr:hypothetical protein [Candidatus Kerfeldbacteria bacterium]